MDIIERIEASIEVKNKILNDQTFLNRIENSIDICVNAMKSGNKVWFCGNGGSAADAQHLAAELSGRFYFDRRPLPAEALHVNSSFVTAVANDFGFDQVYARMLRGSAKEGDVLVAISTSGNSVNVLNAIGEAKLMGMPVIGLTGETGGRMKHLCQVLLNVPSSDTPRIQEAHIMIGHLICEQIESIMFG